MAYTQHRSTGATNAITLINVEICPEPTMQAFVDLKKAFNTANRSAIIERMQKLYGFSDIMTSWFEDRQYHFKFPHSQGRNPQKVFRGRGHNAGVPAGTILGVAAFTEFMETCPEMTQETEGIMWNSLFADDYSPLTAKSIAAKFQLVLQRVYQWSLKMKVSFHLSGKKGPKSIPFLKKGQVYPK